MTWRLGKTETIKHINKTIKQDILNNKEIFIKKLENRIKQGNKLLQARILKNENIEDVKSYIKDRELSLKRLKNNTLLNKDIDIIYYK